MLNNIKTKRFTPYINFGRIFRKKIFYREASRSCITGFTLIEVVVAVFILIIGVLAAFNVVQNVTVFSKGTSSRLTAAYLAQEGIELVRNQRDSNWLAGIPWDLSLPSGPESDILGRFDRNTTITPQGANEIEVSVEVSWREKGKDYSVTAQTELYNWYDPI